MARSDHNKQPVKSTVAPGKTASKGSAGAKGKKPFKPVRGRPTAAQAEAISRTILDNARELFLANGYESTTMETIARKSGIPKSTLYKRYTDKMTLLQAVINDRLSTWSTSSASRDTQLSDDLEQRLKQRLHTVLNWHATDEVRAFTRLASGAGESAAVVARIFRDTGYAAVLGYLERDIRELADSNPDAVKDPKAVAVALMATLTGWIALIPQDQEVSIAEASAFTDRAVEIAIHGRAAW